MSEEKTRREMLNALDIMLDEGLPYQSRLDAYEFLLEDCGEIVDEMLSRSYALDGETGKMLMEVLAGYKGNPAIYMGLVSYLYKGDDVALFAKLIGSYGDIRGVKTLKDFCEEYEPNYNEYMEIRNAIEQLGGDFDLGTDFSDDPLYRFLKGLDETDDRKSPFEDMLNPDRDYEDELCEEDYDSVNDDLRHNCDCDDDDCDDDCHCHDDACRCHEHRRK